MTHQTAERPKGTLAVLSEPKIARSRKIKDLAPHQNCVTYIYIRLRNFGAVLGSQESQDQKSDFDPSRLNHPFVAARSLRGFA